MTLKVYIAGASAEIDTIETRMMRLRHAGAEIVGDWCADIRAAGMANAGLTIAQRVVYSGQGFRCVGEWFRPGDDLLSFIEGLRP